MSLNINLLPGPVNIPLQVRTCMLNPPFSHRVLAFKRLYKEIVTFVKSIGMPEVQILQGNGTLANDVVANQLLGIYGKGLILENGEFGKRLLRQAQVVGLDYMTFSSKPGAPVAMDKLQQALLENDIKWVWFVHCETSTGQVNPIQEIVKRCNELNIICAVDAISTLGNFPVHFYGVSFVSSTSGKGLSSFPGLSLVMYRKVLNENAVSHFLDLAYHVKQNNVPFTLSSNQLQALNEGFKFSFTQEHFNHIANLSQIITTWEFNHFKRMEVDAHNPAVHTFIVAKNIDALFIGDLLEAKGVTVNCRTQYLNEVNAFQICLMGDISGLNLKSLLEVLNEIDEKCEFIDLTKNIQELEYKS